MRDHINDLLLFYLLSAVAQTLVGVVAFVGLVAVWRLQQLDGTTAFRVEREIQRGSLAAGRPYLNPL